MKFSETIFGVIIAAVLLGLVWLFWFDSSQLSPPIVHNLTLLDKWHEEDCTPIFDGSGNYLGESCSDEWTLVVMENDQRRTMTVRKDLFSQIRPGESFQYSVQLGRLGGEYNRQFKFAPPPGLSNANAYAERDAAMVP